MFNALKSLMSKSEDDTPVFRPPEDRPRCNVVLVHDGLLLFLGFHQGETNRWLRTLALPCTYNAMANLVFEALAAANVPGPGGSAGDPPYYMQAAGFTDPLKYHKATSVVSVGWIMKPHKAGTNIYAPGIYLYPMRRERRAGSFIGASTTHTRGPIPPDEHERIGREVLELFDIIRTDYDRGPLPLRA